MKTVIIVVVVVLVVVVLVIAAALIGTSLKKINSDEVGLIYNKLYYTLGSEPKLEGLHTGPPGFDIVIFPNVFKTIKFSDLQCLNKDGVKIVLNVEYQYRPVRSAINTIAQNFKDFDSFQELLEVIGDKVPKSDNHRFESWWILPIFHQVESWFIRTAALHDSCSMYNTTQFQTERGAFQGTILVNLKARYAEFNCTVGDLQVNNIARPSAYEGVIQHKEIARGDIDVARNEHPRRITQATTEKLQAETQGQIIIDKTKSEARIRENQAELEAEAIRRQYEKEAEAYRFILDKNGLNLTEQGFISYLGSRLIASAQKDVYISLDSPAKTSFLP